MTLEASTSVVERCPACRGSSGRWQRVSWRYFDLFHVWMDGELAAKQRPDSLNDPSTQLRQPSLSVWTTDVLDCGGVRH